MDEETREVHGYLKDEVKSLAEPLNRTMKLERRGGQGWIV